MDMRVRVWGKNRNLDGRINAAIAALILTQDADYGPVLVQLRRPDM